MCLGWSGSVRAMRMPSSRVGAAGPDLRAVDDVLVAVAHRSGRQAGQVGAGVGLGEQLAPDLLAAEDLGKVPLVLLGCSGEEDGRGGPPGADGIARAADAGPGEFVVDDQLVDRIGVDSPRLRPVRDDISGLDQLDRGGVRVFGDPGSNLCTRRVILGRKVEVHRSAVLPLMRPWSDSAGGRRIPSMPSAACLVLGSLPGDDGHCRLPTAARRGRWRVAVRRSHPSPPAAAG